MLRPVNPSHGLEKFHLYEAGIKKRETIQFYEALGQTFVYYKLLGGAPLGSRAFVEDGVTVYTCTAKDFLTWVENPEAEVLQSV